MDGLISCSFQSSKFIDESTLDCTIPNCLHLILHYTFVYFTCICNVLICDRQYYEHKILTLNTVSIDYFDN